MRLWLVIWRLNFYLGLDWYNQGQSWYNKIPPLLEVSNSESFFLTIRILFLCFVLQYEKRWNGDEFSPEWYWF